MIKQIPFQILDLDDEARKLRVALGVKAGVVAGNAAKAHGLKRIADRGTLLRQLGRIAGHAGLLHHLLEQINDVVRFRVGVVRDFF